MRALIHLLPCLLSLITVTNTRTLAAPARPTLDYMLVVTGEELLRGAFADAHTAFITRTLHLLGGHCVGSIIVDDKADDIREAIRVGTNKAPVVIVTGGLGPTVNDVTRGAMADVTGIKLAEHPAVLAELERRFQQPRAQLRDNIRRQALVPTRGTFLKNREGTAVGLVFEPERGVIVALPGPPRELQPMMTNELIPYLQRKFGLRTPGASLTLRFVGIGQSQIDQAIHEHVKLPTAVVVGSMFEGSRVDFMFSLPGDTPAGHAPLAGIESALRMHLGEHLYANDHTSLESHVVQLLQARATSLVLVEVGSGGRLAASLSDVPRVEQLLTAAFVAPTEERMRHTLEIPSAAWESWKPGEERTKGLARAAQKRSVNAFVLAIGERRSDEAGKPFVWMAFGSSPENLRTQRVEGRGTGELAQANLVTQILDALRRSLNSTRPNRR